MHFNLGLFFALLLRRKSCYCLSAIRSEQGQAATARACERRPLTERAQPALTIKRPRETLLRLFLPTTPEQIELRYLLSRRFPPDASGGREGGSVLQTRESCNEACEDGESKTSKNNCLVLLSTQRR